MKRQLLKSNRVDLNIIMQPNDYYTNVPSSQRVPKLNFSKVTPQPEKKKGLATRTTRQYIQSPTSRSLKSARSFAKKGVYSMKVVEDTEDMNQEDFVKKYRSNPYFRYQITVTLQQFYKDSQNLYFERDSHVKNSQMAEDQYGLFTLKDQRKYSTVEAKGIHHCWVQWLEGAGITIKK